MAELHATVSFFLHGDPDKELHQEFAVITPNVGDRVYLKQNYKILYKVTKRILFYGEESKRIHVQLHVKKVKKHERNGF